MSYLLNAEPSYINDEMEDLFLSENENEDYNFKYVPANQFKYIVKDVRRQRCREEEDNIWASFVKQQELNGLTYDKNNIHPSVRSIKELLDENMKEADKELKKFEIDVLSDRIKRECDKVGINQKKSSKVNNIRDSSPKKLPIVKSTDSTNLLLAIPEEGNIRQSKQKPENFKSSTRKSCSSHVMPQRKHSKQLLHTTNGVEYNSSPENSAHRDRVANGIIYVRPDPFTMNKILAMQKKIIELLDEIAFRLGNIPMPDGIKDLQKRQQCVTEFAVRFSRNYLYDLNRYIKDIQRHMYIISPRARIKPNQRSLGLHMHAIEHKLLAAHQLLLHALIAYCKHIPSSILGGHPGKLKELLQVIIDLKTMCDRLQLNYLDSGDNDILPLGKDMESKCNAILSKLKLQPDNDFLVDKTPSMASFSPYSKTNKNRFGNRQLSNRLSMYSVDTKVPRNNPKHRNSCYHRKNRKYNTIDIKEVCNEPIQDQQYPSPTTVRSSKDVSYTSIRKNKIYAKEEDIKTMMDILPIDSDHGSNIEVEEKHDNINLIKRKSKTPENLSGKLQNLTQAESIERIVKSTRTNNDDELVKKVTMITEEHLSNLVPVIADLISFMSKRKESGTRTISTTSVKTLMDFLQKYQSSKFTNTKVSASTSQNMCHSSTDSSYEYEHFKTNRTSYETRKSGENMQLICMSSIEDASKTFRYCDASCQVNRENVIKLSDFEMKMEEGRRIQDSLKNIEFVIPEETETNFLRYKCEYQSLTQAVPMYSSNTQNKPWDIVAWISDKLVDELIAEIAKELQIDDVIQKLFELEFQEF